MGNGRGSKNGEGTSGVDKFEDNNHDQSMEFAESIIQFAESISTPQALISNPQNSAFSENVFRETSTRVRISWNHGGLQVAVLGSWDNWETRELLQNTGKEFVVIKSLPVGIYHYHFIVDGWLAYAPDLPWICDDSGNAYNILDLQGNVSELPETMSEFQSPPSPPSSYDNEYLNEDDFSTPPLELPPQLQRTILNDPSPSVGDQQSPVTPQHTELNHLYIQNNVENQFVALGSTHKISQKYVTMFLFKPSSRTR